jgi:hypothetical protein
MTRQRLASWSCSPCQRGQKHNTKKILKHDDLPLPTTNKNINIESTHSSPLLTAPSTEIMTTPNTKLTTNNDIDKNILENTMGPFSSTSLNENKLNAELTDYINSKIELFITNITFKFDALLNKLDEKYNGLFESINFCVKKTEELEITTKKSKILLSIMNYLKVNIKTFYLA